MPCIDFGHPNARTLGGIASKADYAAILDRMEQSLGDERARRFHAIFPASNIQPGAKNATGPLHRPSLARNRSL